ncbi:MAG: hypothetical protein WAU63_05505, partial [Methylovirgula sp.]
AQSCAFAANDERTSLIQRIGELEKTVADLETWEAEKQRYDLIELAPGLVCYMVKEAMRGGEPPHRLCANCYSGGKKSFLQKQISGEYYDEYRCNCCGEKIPVDKGDPPQPKPFRPEYF